MFVSSKGVPNFKRIFKLVCALKCFSNGDVRGIEPQGRPLHLVGAVPHFVSQLLNVRVVEESHFVSLANQSHHIASLDVEVRESEACLLLTSLHFQYSRRQPSQTPYYAFGFVAQKGQRACGLESGGEQLNEEKEELEGVSNVEEEIVSLMESVVEFGLENGDELTHLREGEVLPKVRDKVDQDLG